MSAKGRATNNKKGIRPKAETMRARAAAGIETRFESTRIDQSAFQPSAKARALLAGVRRAEEDLRLGGGAFPLEDVLALLRVSRQAVHNKVREGSLFVVKGPGGRLMFPTLQFS